MKKGSRMLQICVLAYNSVLHDARVLKEADSLAKFGYDVTVLGFGDNRATPGIYARPSGASVQLLSTKPEILNSSPQQVASRLPRMVVRGIIGALAAGLLYLLGVLALYISGSKYSLLLMLPVISLIGAIALVGELRIKQAAKRISRMVGRMAGKLLKPFLRIAKRHLGNRIKQRILANAAIELRPGIIHCHDLMTLPAGQYVKAHCGAKLVWDAHEIYEEVAQSDKAARRRSRRIMRMNQKGVDAFITINDSIAGFYADKYPFLPPAVIVKNATMPIAPFNYDGRLHAKANLPRNQRIALYQGGFAEKRGLRKLVAAAEFLNPSWTLVMMGWGRLEETLRQISADVANRTSERTLPSVVFLPPSPQAELHLWTAGAEVGLIPYERTGLNHLYCTPNKLWEYPNAGVPILCSPLIEMSKVITKHGVGWLLPDDPAPEAIAGRINCLTESALATARSACRTYVATDNWTVYERRLAILYDALASNAARASCCQVDTG